MPSGVYIRTEETKRKIREARKGKHYSPETEFKKGNHPKTEFKKGDNNRLGKCHTEKSKRIISDALRGEKNPRWNGGKIKITCQYCGKVRELSPCRIKEGGGKYCSVKCTNLAKKGKKFSEKWKRNLRESRIKYLSTGEMPRKDTSIELIIEKELKRVNLNFQKQVAICKVGVVDFFLPECNVIIECDGSYWHSIPKVKQRDATKDLVWMFNNYKVFRFWEHEINESPKKCIKAVLRYIKYNRLFKTNLKVIKK